MGEATNLQSYLIYRAASFIIVSMTKKGYINLVLLPQLLKALPAHWLFGCPLVHVPFTGGVTKHTMCQKDEPWLLLMVHLRKAVLNELVLFCPFSPVFFSVRYA